MAVNDVFQAVIEQKLHNQTVLNVLHFRLDADQPTAVALNQDVRTIIIPTMKGVQSNELQHVAVWTQKIWPLPPLNAVRDATAAGPGTVAQNSLPTSVAVVLTKRTAFAGRKYRGRVYVCGVPVTHESDSTLAAANQAAWQALADKFAFAAWAASDFTPIIWHRGPKTDDTVITVEARTILRNQRRRQVGVGA